MKREIAIPNTIISGRDIMITLGNAFRGLHPYILSQILLNEMLNDREPHVWIVENWGFPDESFFWHEQHVQSLLPDVLLIHTIHLDARASRPYAAGEIFDGDNRWCLRHLANHVNPPVNGIAKLIDPAHDYPIDPIAVRFGGNTTPLITLEEAFERLDSENDSMWDSDGLPSLIYLKGVTYLQNLSMSDVVAAVLKYGIPNREILRMNNFAVVQDDHSDGDELVESDDEVMDHAMDGLEIVHEAGDIAEINGVISVFDGQDWAPVPDLTESQALELEKLRSNRIGDMIEKRLD